MVHHYINKILKKLKANVGKDLEIINRLQSTIASGISPQSRDMESVQQELDDIVASQCILCGERAVDCLDEPLDAVL